MKKIIVLLSIVLLSITGCSIKKLDNKQFDKNVDTLLSEKVSISNVDFEGYKYYLPDGLKFLNKEEYNAVFRDRFENKYYLYVDVIGYYHDTLNTYEENTDAYFSKKLAYNGKSGYLEINEVDDKYFIEYVFHYGKIEALVDKDSLVNVINNSSYVLRSIQYNDEILESLVGDNILSYAEENFSLFETQASQEDFLDVVKEYDKGYSKAKDQEKLELDDE